MTPRKQRTIGDSEPMSASHIGDSATPAGDIFGYETSQAERAVMHPQPGDLEWDYWPTVWLP